MHEQAAELKSSAKNGPEVVIVRSKLKNFFWRQGVAPPYTPLLGASILMPTALDYGPLLANPGSTTADGC